MSLIPCAENCIHQQEGYCCLVQSGKVSCAGWEGNGCVYYISREKPSDGPSQTPPIGHT